jgi:hypothetical protein
MDTSAQAASATQSPWPTTERPACARPHTHPESAMLADMIETFADFLLPEPLLRGIAKAGW